MATIETSIEAYRKIGISLNDRQFEGLCNLNLLAQGNDNKDIPIHFIVMTLKVLGLLPPELMCEVCNDKTADNAKNIRDCELQQEVGVFKER